MACTLESTFASVKLRAERKQSTPSLAPVFGWSVWHFDTSQVMSQPAILRETTRPLDKVSSQL